MYHQTIYILFIKKFHNYLKTFPFEQKIPVICLGLLYSENYFQYVIFSYKANKSILTKEKDLRKNMERQKFFGTADYIIFALTLLLSSAIGIYFAYRQRKKLSSNEYLRAGKSVPRFPLFVSMVASHFSAIGLIGTPSGIYTTGITFTFIYIGAIMTIMISAQLFVPFFRKLELVSANQVRKSK